MSGTATRLKEGAKLGYVKHLDGLRAVSIAAVMIVHMANSKRLGKGGWIGVDVFFVLSGFLITVLLLEDARRAPNGRPSLSRFYLRRAFRLMPALFAFLGLALLFGAIYRSSVYGTWAHDLFMGATYRMNFYSIGHQALQGTSQTWTLCMEEQFYLVWPVALILLSAVLRPRAIMTIVGVGVAASLGINVLLYMHHVDFRRLYYAPDTNAGSLLLGCLAGLAFHAGYLQRLAGMRLSRWFPAAFLVLLGGWTLLVGNTDRIVYAGPTTVFCLLAALAIACLLVEPGSVAGRFLAWAPMVWIGRLSYSLYLWNDLLFKVAPKIGPGSVGAFGKALVALVLTFGAATASYYLVEQPFIRLKKRIDQSLANRQPDATPGGPVASGLTDGSRRALGEGMTGGEVVSAASVIGSSGRA